MVSTQWLETGAGASLLEEEGRQVRRALDAEFGDQFLQIGSWGADRFRTYARTKRTTVIDSQAGGNVDIVSAPDCLGVASDSIDIVLLAHILETHDDPHGVLREVDRVLRADGRAIILGFSPVSLLGFRHFVTRRRFPPGIRRMISEHRLRDWLRLLNFSVDRSSFQYFNAPVRRRSDHSGSAPSLPDDEAADPRANANPQRFDKATARTGARVVRAARSSWKAGRAAWRRYAPFASSYIVIAHKDVYTVTPIRPVWAPRRRLVGGLVNPTTRGTAS
jgi:SAM-dependent methyltransferase